MFSSYSNSRIFIKLFYISKPLISAWYLYDVRNNGPIKKNSKSFIYSNILIFYLIGVYESETSLLTENKLIPKPSSWVDNEIRC